MTPEEEITKIESDLEVARRDLQETLSAVNAKIESEVERVEESFNPDELLRNNMVGAACVAGVIGFLVGSSKYRTAVIPIVLGALGYTIWSGLSKEGSDENGREPIGP
jgi:molybdopterin converting factor small subunit